MVSLKMKQEPHHCGEGVQRIYTFKNGTELSAIRTPYSYGGKDGLWEIAVLDANGNWLTRDIWHDLYDDVIGYVTDNQLKEYVDDVYHFDMEY